MTVHYPYLDVSAEFNKEILDLDYSKQCKEFNADGLIIGPINLSEESRKPLFLNSNGEKPLNWAFQLVSELKKLNKKVILSFGGGQGSDIDEVTLEEFNQGFNEIIQLYKPNLIELNLDVLVYKLETIVLMFHSIKETLTKKENSDIGLIITVPIKPSTGLGNEEFEMVTIAATDVQLQFLLNGIYSDILNQDYSSKLAKGAIESIKKVIAQLDDIYPNKGTKDIVNSLAITPMIGLNNNSTMFTLEDAQELSNFASKNCLSFTSHLSINRDHPQKSNNPNQTDNGQYTKLFVSSNNNNNNKNE